MQKKQSKCFSNTPSHELLCQDAESLKLEAWEYFATNDPANALWLRLCSQGATATAKRERLLSKIKTHAPKGSVTHVRRISAL